MDEGNPVAFSGIDSREDGILIGEDERGIFITALGSVRATLCYPLRESVLSRIEEAADVPAVFVDLSRSRYMDSTFIGLLVAMDRRLQRGPGGRLHLVDPSPECLDLLRQLGLLEILLVQTGGMNPPAM